MVYDKSPSLTRLQIWLVVEPTPLKNMSSSVGIIPNIWKNKKMFQTTNQNIDFLVTSNPCQTIPCANPHGLWRNMGMGQNPGT